MSSTDHAKANEVLESIEAARVQRERNESFRNELLDSEDLLQEISLQLYSMKLHLDVQALTSEADRNREIFEAGFSYSWTVKKHLAKRYMETCELNVSLADLIPNGVAGSKKAIGVLELSLAQRPQSSDPLFWDRVALLAQRSDKLIDAAGIDSTPWCSVIEPGLRVLLQILCLRSVTGPLHDIAVQLRLLNSEALKYEKQVAESSAAGEVAVLEEAYPKLIMLLEGISDLITQKFHIFDKEEETVISALEEMARSSLQHAKNSASQVESVTANKRQAVELDLQRLNRSVDIANSTQSKARQLFLAERNVSDEFLKKNSLDQDVIWEEINRAEAQLRILSQTRRDEIDRRVKRIEREERRQVEMDHFQEFAEKHRAILNAALQRCEAEELLCSMMLEIYRGCVGSSRTLLNGLKTSLSEHFQRTLDDHLTHFSRQYLLLGDLLFKKERLLEELKQKAHVAKSLQELAMDSFNPRAREYALERQEYDVIINNVENQLVALRRKAALYVEAFKPTEKALNAAGRPFLHPLQQLVQIDRGRATSMAEYHTLQVATYNMTRCGVDISQGVVQAERDTVVEDQSSSQRVKEKPLPGRALRMQKFDTGMSALD